MIDNILGNPSPNPANQYFKIDFSIPISKNVTIKLVSQTEEKIILTEEKVFPKGDNKLFINIKELELSAGSYLIIFNFDKVILSERIIVL